MKTLKEIKNLTIQGIKKEAIKRVKNCCPVKYPESLGLTPSRCIACERDILFYDLTEDDLK